MKHFELAEIFVSKCNIEHMIRREEGRKKLRIHIVQKGDTLWKIAKEYGISFEDLKRLNVHLANPDYIVPGMEIILPEKINKEQPHRDAHKEMPRKETHVPKETPITKEAPKKEVQKPMPPPLPIVPPPPAPMPMPEPHMIPIPIPMPMPMPQQPMWVPQPVEMNWHQQVVMPQMEQNVMPPPVQIQPAPKPTPKPAPPPPVPKPQPTPPPPPKPQPAPPPPPVQMMPQMPAVPHCPSCHQPVYHQMWWPMPMQPHVEPYMMQQQPMPCDMPKHKIGGMDDFLESTPFFPKHEPQMQPQFDMNMGQSCGCGPQSPPMMMPDMNMGQSCGCGPQSPPMMMPDMNMGQSCGCGPQPAMMPTWYMDPSHCPPPPCPSGGPWMPPHYFPGGMTPYRW